MELKNTVEAENNHMAEKFQEAFLNYSDFMEELSRDEEVFSGDLSSSQRAEVFDLFYSVSNDMKINGDLYLFLNEKEPILLGRKNLPYHLEGQSYGNWSIFNMMKARRETLSVRVMEESEGNMQLVFNRRVLKEGVPVGYIVIVMDGRKFRVGEVADLCGFSDYKYYSVFKKYTGIAPRSTRKDRIVRYDRCYKDHAFQRYGRNASGRRYESVREE